MNIVKIQQADTFKYLCIW